TLLTVPVVRDGDCVRRTHVSSPPVGAAQVVHALRQAVALPGSGTQDLCNGNKTLDTVGKALEHLKEHGTDEQRVTTQRHLTAIAEEAWDRYAYLIDIGICDEIARTVLPTSLYTQLWMTGSLRSWLHFLNQRADKHAQHEIQEAANK